MNLNGKAFPRFLEAVSPNPGLLTAVLQDTPNQHEIMICPDDRHSGHLLASQGHLNVGSIFNSMSQSSETTTEVVRCVTVLWG